MAEERIVLEILVGCHGRHDEEALEGGRGQVDSGASLLEAFEIDESGYAAAGAATADFRNPLDENRRLESSSSSMKTAHALVWILTKHEIRYFEEKHISHPWIFAHLAMVVAFDNLVQIVSNKVNKNLLRC